MATVHIEPGSDLIVAEVDVMLSVEAMHQHQEELQAAISVVKRRHPHFDLLVCTTGNAMPKTVADDAKHMIAKHQEMGVRKVAIVVPSVVARMQMRRVSEGTEHLQSFHTEVEARAWLAE